MAHKYNQFLEYFLNVLFFLLTSYLYVKIISYKWKQHYITMFYWRILGCPAPSHNDALSFMATLHEPTWTLLASCNNLAHKFLYIQTGRGARKRPEKTVKESQKRGHSDKCQPKLYSPIRGQLGALCQWQGAIITVKINESSKFFWNCSLSVKKKYSVVLKCRKVNSFCLGGADRRCCRVKAVYILDKPPVYRLCLS